MLVFLLKIPCVMPFTLTFFSFVNKLRFHNRSFSSKRTYYHNTVREYRPIRHRHYMENSIVLDVTKNIVKMFQINISSLRVYLACTGVDVGGQPGHLPSIIEKRPCIYHFCHLFLPNILVCPLNFFDKYMPLLAWHYIVFKRIKYILILN